MFFHQLDNNTQWNPSYLKRPTLYLLIVVFIVGAFWLYIPTARAQSPNPLNNLSPIGFFGVGEDIRSAAWGDVDSDGDLDLAVGVWGKPNKLYLNEGGNLQINSDASWTPDESDNTNDIAWGDVDNDGDLDLAVGNTPRWNGTCSCGDGGGVTVYVNQGGRLETTTTWRFGDSDDTRSVAWGDVDGDGDLDLAAGNSGGQSYVYRNDGLNPGGDLQMTLAWTTPAAEETQSLAWGDYDNDGDLDLAVGNMGTRDGNRLITGNAKIYRNDGLDEMRELQLIEVWSAGDNDFTFSVAWGDVDGDGDLDLAVGNSQVYDENQKRFIGDANKVYLNQQGGLLETPAWTAAAPDATRRIAWGDIDSDGDLDLMAMNFFSDHVLYLNEKGKLNKSGVTGIDGGTDDPGAMAWGDVDGDGDFDLALVTRNGSSRLFQNDDSGLQTSADTPDRFGNNQVILSTAWGDVDGDGDLDLAVGNRDKPNEIYLNDGGQLQTTSSWTDGNPDPTFSVAWGDVDGDGDLDLAVGAGNLWEYQSKWPNRIYQNNGLDSQGTLQMTLLWTEDSSDNTSSIAWGDADNDGDLDLAIGNLFGGPTIVYRNDGLSDGMLQMAASWVSKDSGSTRSVAWGDVDNDGDLDLAIGINRGQNKVYRNNGLDRRSQLQMSLLWSSGSPDATSSVAWGDVDGDGDLDLAAGNGAGPNKLYLNRNGTLQTNMDSPWLSMDTDSTNSIAWGDVDGDGDLDLAAGNRLGGPNKVYFNQDGVLQTTNVWNDGGRDWDTVTVAWGDVDGDGDLDLAAGNLGAGSQIYLNRRSVQSPQAAQAPALTFVPPSPTIPSANFYASAKIHDSGIITLTYALFHPRGEPVRQIEAAFSLDGGDHWLEAKPVTGTRDYQPGHQRLSNYHSYQYPCFCMERIRQSIFWSKR